MSFRTTLVLLALAVILGAYTLVYERGEQSDAKKMQEVAVFDDKFESKDVQKIDITAPDAKLTVERAGDKKWTLSSPVGARADKASADAVADALAGLKSTQSIPKPKSLAPYGLEKPAVTIDFQVAGKPAPRTLLLGEKSIDNAAQYAKRADAETVYLIPTTLQSQVSKKADDWRDKNLASVNLADVVALEIQREEGSKLAFEKQNDRWMMTEPSKIPASKEEVESILRDLTGLRVDTFVKDGAQPADLAANGLDHPRYSVKLRVGDTASTQILFGSAEAKPTPTAAPTSTPLPKGKKAPTPEPTAVPTPPAEEVAPNKNEKVFASLADEGSIYLVQGTVLEKLAAKPEHFYLLEPFNTQQWQAQRLEVRLEDLAVVLEKDAQSEWQVAEPEGKTVDYGKASGLLSDVYALRFEGMAPEGSKVEEKGRVSVTPEKKGDAEQAAETLIVGAIDAEGNRLVQRNGESWIYRMRDASLSPVRDAVKEIQFGPPTPVPTAAPAAGAKALPGSTDAGVAPPADAATAVPVGAATAVPAESGSLDPAAAGPTAPAEAAPTP